MNLLTRSSLILIGISVATLGTATARDFTVRLQPRTDESGATAPSTPADVKQTAAIVSKRLVALGFKKPEITIQDDRSFTAKTGDLKPAQSKQVVAAIEKPGNLELREVSPRNEETGPDGKSLAERVQSGDELVPGYRAYSLTLKDEDGKEISTPILINRRAAIRSSDIESANPSPVQKDTVDIALNADGTDKMIALTENMRVGQDRIAIVLDGVVISAPVVQATPLGKRFQISGLREPGETQNLANSLMNPLGFTLAVEKQGPDSIQKDAK